MSHGWGRGGLEWLLGWGRGGGCLRALHGPWTISEVHGTHLIGELLCWGRALVGHAVVGGLKWLSIRRGRVALRVSSVLLAV